MRSCHVAKLVNVSRRGDVGLGKKEEDLFEMFRMPFDRACRSQSMSSNVDAEGQ